MKRRKRYPKDWPKMARKAKEQAGWKCEECGVKHGTKRLSKWTGNEWPVYLQAAHVHHDPENHQPVLVAVCPFCHWHVYRKPGTRPAWMIERAKHRRLIAIAYCV